MVVKLDITDALRRPGETFSFTHAEYIEPQDIMGEIVTFDPVRMEGSCTLNDGKLHLKGRLATIAHGTCAKCLDAAHYPVNLSFHEIFSRKGESDEEEADDLDQTDRLAYDGPQLAVDQLALTLVVLELPMRFLCKEDCRGFEESEEVNQHKHCRDDANVQRPFAALQQLLAEKSDNKE